MGCCVCFFHSFLEWDSSEGPDQIKNAPHRNRGKCVLLQLQMIWAFLQRFNKNYSLIVGCSPSVAFTGFCVKVKPDFYKPSIHQLRLYPSGSWRAGAYDQLMLGGGGGDMEYNLATLDPFACPPLCMS